MLAVYILLCALSTMLMAVNCWAAALAGLVCALGIAVYCFVQNRKRGLPYGVERRTRPRG